MKEKKTEDKKQTKRVTTRFHSDSRESVEKIIVCNTFQETFEVVVPIGPTLLCFAKGASTSDDFESFLTYLIR